MKQSILFLFSCSIFFSISSLNAQSLTGTTLLQKSMAYHDPGGKWSSFKGGLHLTETRPNGPDRKTHLHLNNKTSFFELIQHKDKDELVYVYENEQCIHLLNGSQTISEEDRTTHRLTCERTKLLRDYYLYLWGLPMKLTDTGTKIHEAVQETSFQNQPVLALKVEYDQQVGDDIWYFYFHPTTYALVGYRFYHEEAKNDGEYITLEGEKLINGIRFPKTRKWYYNKDDQYLGADILE